MLDITGDLSGLDPIRSTFQRFGVERRVRMLSGLSAEERHVVFEGASALLMASKAEGFGFQVLKPQLAGLPVIAADAGAPP